MAESLTDTLTGLYSIRLNFTRTDTQETGSVSQTATKLLNYEITDGDGAGEADLVFSDTRTIPANTVEVINLLTLTQQTFEVAVPYTFRQVRLIRVINNETAANRRLLIGADPGRPQSTYAMEVGPGSEFSAINNVDAWIVTSENSELQIANPSSVAVSYSLYILGTSTQAMGGSGSGA